MADFLSQANAFALKLLEGDAAGTVIELEGRALPYRGINYETEQRVKTTYYTGNPVATQQRLGPVEKNTTVTGTWKDIFLGNGIAALLRDTFDGLVRSGTMVELTWGAGFLPDGTQVSKPLVRQGVIKRFRHTYDRPQDIQWEMEFEWRGRDEAAQPPLQGAGQGDDGFAALAESLDASGAAVEAWRTDPLTELAGFTDTVRGAFDSVGETIAGASTTLNDVTRTLATTADLPNELLDRVRGTTTDVIAALGNFQDVALRIFLLDIEVRDSALATLDLVSRRLDMMLTIDATREQAAQVDAAMAARQAPDVIAEVRPVPGTDLRDLARQYYGDPDLWWVIASFNGFPQTSKVPAPPLGPTDTPPRALRIPRRPEGAQGSLSKVC